MNADRKGTRRQFVTVAGAATLTAQASPNAMAATTIGRIDCQSHLFSQEFLAFLEKRKSSPYVYRKDGQRFVVVNDWHRAILPNHTDVAAKISVMDAAGIEKA